MRNKFARGSFSADELIRIADFVNCQLAFNIDADQKSHFNNRRFEKSCY